MYEHVKKPKENKSRAVANVVGQKKSNGKRSFGFVDNRPEAVLQRKLQKMTDNHSAVHKTNHNLIQRIEKKRTMVTHDGEKQIQWETIDLKLDNLKPSDARKILKNIKLEEMRASPEEIQLLQKSLMNAKDINPLTEEDAQWVEESGLIHKFHTSGETLKVEYDNKSLKGHQTALYDFKKDESKTKKLKNLFMSLINVGTASLSHVEGSDVKAGHVLSTSNPKEQINKLITWANAPSYLADTSSQPLGEIAEFIPQNVSHRSFEDFHDSLVEMLDIIITFIRTRGKSVKPTQTISELKLPIFDDELLQGLMEMEEKPDPQITEKKKDSEGMTDASSNYKQIIGVFGQLPSGEWCRTDGQDKGKRFRKEGGAKDPLFVNIDDEFDQYEEDGKVSFR